MTLSNHWNQRIYALWAPVYDLLIRFHPVTRLRARSMEAADVSAASDVLLVGVGTGADLPHLAHLHLQSQAREVDIVGVDLSPAMLKRCRRTAKRLNLPLVTLCGDAAALPLSDNAFDVVVLTLIVSVVLEPQACVAEAMRVLRPNGKVVVVDKFLPCHQNVTVLRRLLNIVTRPFGTDINRRWEDIAPAATRTIIDQSSQPVGSMRVIVLQKVQTPKDTH